MADPLLEDPNINTQKPASGNSQQAAAYVKNPQTSRELVYVSAPSNTGSSSETKTATGGRQRLTEDGRIAVRGQQAPERDVHQHLEAGPVEDGRLG